MHAQNQTNILKKIAKTCKIHETDLKLHMNYPLSNMLIKYEQCVSLIYVGGFLSHIWTIASVE